jgi:hypothetical protein
MVVVWTTITTLKIIWRLKQRVEVYSGLGVALCEFEASTVESVLPGDYDVCSLCSPILCTAVLPKHWRKILFCTCTSWVSFLSSHR